MKALLVVLMNISRKSVRFTLLTLTIICVIQVGSALGKTIVIMAPHPDDETLMAAGIIQAAVDAGDVVKVVVVTNGDIKGTTSGYTRQGESVAAMELLGIREDDVVFLGFGDALLMNIYNASSETTVFTSTAGQTQTYGNRGLGRRDYHSYVYGVPGPYNHRTITQDLMNVLEQFSPDEIYTTSFYDAHLDHRATYLLVVEAILKLQRRGRPVPAQLYESMVHAPMCPSCTGVDSTWPPSSFTPSLPFPQPAHLDTTPLDWHRLHRRSVPSSMQTPDRVTNLKYQVISEYQSQLNTWIYGFVKKDEFAWITHVRGNLAATADVTVSSQNSATQQLGSKAVDGIVAGYPASPKSEWATLGQLAGAWIRLSWPSPVAVSQVILHDRVNGTDNVLAGRLLFSDGTGVSVGPLPPDGAELAVTFAPKITTSVEFRIDQAGGQNIGLAEIRVLGKPAGSLQNSPPIIVHGPTAASEALTDIASTRVTVTGLDFDGDTLQYEWSAEAGTMSGSGASATFTPPRVSTSTFVAVTVTIRDGRGGAATNTTFINVTPSGAAVALQSLTVTDAVIGSGQTTTAMVTLSAAAPSSGVSILLTTSNTTAVKIPASVVVLSGATNATFTITAGSVAADTMASVSAAFGGTVKSAAVKIVPNLASRAAVTVSSQNTSTGQLGIKAIDGIVNGWPGDYTKEWATVRQLAGAWIRLTWSAPVTVSEVSLYDRPNATDNVLAGRLVFSNGSAVTVGPLPASGSERRVAFPGRTITWVEFRINQAAGINIGLAEFRVFAKSSAMVVAPTLTVPVSSENTTTGQLGVEAVDRIVDGWPGDYTQEWATVRQHAGAWIRLTGAPVTISEVTLYDRPSTTDIILAGRLLFSDGSVIAAGTLPAKGAEARYGSPSGLAEFRVSLQ